MLVYGVTSAFGSTAQSKSTSGVKNVCYTMALRMAFPMKRKLSVGQIEYLQVQGN